jgi:S1-C subfamily serine protease
MTAAGENFAAARARAERALDGVDLLDLFTRWRKVIGPPPEQMGELARMAFDAIRDGLTPTIEQEQALECAIRLLRPAPYVRNSQLDPLDAETARAFPSWESFRSSIRPFLASIGRIDRIPLPGHDPDPVGSCFVVGDRAVLTNSHVVDGLSFGTGSLTGKEAQLKFGQEWGPSPEPEPVAIERVVAVDRDLDLAILATREPLPGRPPVRSAALPVGPGAAVAAVGYPADDDKMPQLVVGLFNSNFGVKRASPGEVLTVRGDRFAHDCTTQAGSSGSPIFLLADARLAGVHTDGMYLARNHAVGGRPLHEFLARHLP